MGQCRRPGRGSPGAERLGSHDRAGQGHSAPFDALDDFDKRLLSFSAPSSPRQRRGRLTVEIMKR